MVSSSNNAILEITRPKTYVAMMIPFKVFVDAQQVGTVRNGSTQSFEVTPGHHVIQIKQGRMVRSNTLALDCASNQTIRLQVTQNSLFQQFFRKYTGKRLADVTGMTLEIL